jgi:Mg2+ and Co2+ transporter CorA
VLAADLAERAKPENARYHYDYYTANCATMVRDTVDKALGGGLQSQLSGRSRGNTYRSESVRLASPAPWMWLGFDVGLGPFADQPLSRWQEAFVPMRLADALRQARNSDGRPLVQSEQELLPHRIDPEPKEFARRWWPWLLLGLVVAGGVLALRNAPAPAGRAGPAVLAAVRLAGSCWCSCGASAPTTPPGPTATCCCSPLAVLLLPGAIALLRRRVPGRMFRVVLWLLAVQAVAALVLHWLSLQAQYNVQWIVLLLPVHVALAWVLGRRPHLSETRPDARWRACHCPPPLPPRLRPTPPASSTASTTMTRANATTSAWMPSAMSLPVATASSGSACTTPTTMLLKLQEEFCLHDLAIEDARNAHQRPKVETYGNSLFVVVTTAQMVDERIQYGETHAFLGPRFLVTVRHGASLSYAPVRARVEREPQLLKMGPSYCLYAVTDFVVDNYLPIVHRFRDTLDLLEKDIFADSYKRSTVVRLYELKRELNKMRMAVAPLQDVLAQLRRYQGDLIPDEVKLYVRDVHDHAVRISDVIDTLREMLGTALSVNLSLVTLAQGETVKRLGAWAACWQRRR